MNNHGLSAAERTRLVHLLARLASDHDGERAAAGLLASRLLDAKGLRWDELIVGGTVYPSSPFPPRSAQQSRPGWRSDVTLCLGAVRSLTAWEIGFVTDLQTRRKPPTPRQIEVLAGSVARIRGATGAGHP